MSGIIKDKENMFMKLFPCNEFNIKSKGLVNHRQHFDANHGDGDFSLKCGFEKCGYTRRNPKVLMKHIGEKHDTDYMENHWKILNS